MRSGEKGGSCSRAAGRPNACVWRQKHGDVYVTQLAGKLNAFCSTELTSL